MVAFATDYEPQTATVEPKNRVGDFFWPTPDRVGIDRSGIRTLAGENGWFSYDACRNPSLAQGRNWPKDKSEVNMMVLPTDEANALVKAGYPASLTGIVHNLTDRTLVAMDENASNVIMEVPPGHSAIGTDGFFDPVVYSESNGRLKYFKLTRGVEISYALSLGPNADPRRFQGLPSAGPINARTHHFFGVVDIYTPAFQVLVPKSATGWKDFFTWPAFERELQAGGYLNR